MIDSRYKVIMKGETNIMKGMMKQKFRRFWAVVLAIAMTIGVMYAPGFSIEVKADSYNNVYIKTADGRYLYANNGQIKLSSTNNPNEYFRWNILDAGNSQYRIQNAQYTSNYFVIQDASAEGDTVGYGTIYDSWSSAKWLVEENGDGTIIKSAWKDHRSIGDDSSYSSDGKTHLVPTTSSPKLYIYDVQTGAQVGPHQETPTQAPTETPTEEPTTAAPVNYITFTVKDCTETSWVGTDSCDLYLYNTSAGIDVKMTKANDGVTFTASIPSTLTTFSLQRRHPTYGAYNGWYDLIRNTYTTYYITGYEGSGETGYGIGQWTEPTSEDFSIYGTPATDSNRYKKYANDEKVVLPEVQDINPDKNSKQTLVSVPGIMYNYLPGGGDNWWNQFKDFDKDMVKYFGGSGKMTIPLLIGAFGGRTSTGSNDNANLEGALETFVDNLGSGVSITPQNRLWYYNHNFTTNGMGSAYDGNQVNVPVQGLVNQYLTADGQLLSSENSVLMPFFNDAFLTGRAQKFGSIDDPIAFPFRDEGNGYYTFESKSGLDNVYMDDDKELVYDSRSSAKIENLTNSNAGFFPFNIANSDSAAATTYSKKLSGNKATSDKGDDNGLGSNDTNYGFGMRLDIPFTVPQDKEEIDYTYNFTKSTLSYTGSTTSKTFVLPENATANQYIIIASKTGSNTNIDGSVKIGNNTINLNDNDGENLHDYGNEEGRGYVYGYHYTTEGNPGISNSYIAFKVTNATDTVTVNYRNWTNNAELIVAAVDDLNSATINAAITEADSAEASNDTVFEFEGDDDLWVFVDGKLALDMGGSHGPANGSINFSTGAVNVGNAKTFSGDTMTNGETSAIHNDLKITDKDTHTMTVFYMERGLYDSNLKIRFNFKLELHTLKNGVTVTNHAILPEIPNTKRLIGSTLLDELIEADTFTFALYGQASNSSVVVNKNIDIKGDGSYKENETAQAQQGWNLSEEVEEGQASIRGGTISSSQSNNKTYTASNTSTYPKYSTTYTITDINSQTITGTTSGLNTGNVTILNKVVDGNENDTDNPVGVMIAYQQVPNVSDITISKAFSGQSSDATRDYTFNLSLDKYFGQTNVSWSDFTDAERVCMVGGVARQISSTGQLTLKAGETATLTLPVASQVTVSEVIPSGVDYFLNGATLDNSAVANPSNGVAADTINSINRAIVFTNTSNLEQTDTLNINNTVTASGVNAGLTTAALAVAGGDTFNFTVNNTSTSGYPSEYQSLHNILPSGTSTTVTGTGSVATKTTNATGTSATELNNKSIRNDDVEILQQQNQKYSTKYSITDGGGNIIIGNGSVGNVTPVTPGTTTISGNTWYQADDSTVRDGKSGASVRVQNATATSDSSVAVTTNVGFYNDINTSSFTITKNYDGDTNKVFTFTVRYTKLFGATVGASGTPASVNGSLDGVTYTVGGNTRTVANNQITLTAGQTATFSGIPVDTIITVIEVDNDNEFRSVAITGSSVSAENDTFTTNAVKAATIGLAGNTPAYAYTNRVPVTENLVFYTEVGKTVNLPLPGEYYDKNYTPDSVSIPTSLEEIDRLGWIAFAGNTSDGSRYGSADNALDYKYDTRFTTGAQSGTEWFALYFGEEYTYDTIILDTRQSPNDEPDQYEVYAVNTFDPDNPNIEGLTNPIAQSTDTPARLTVINVTPQTSKYIIIKQTGSKAALNWSIHEIYAYDSNAVSFGPEAISDTDANYHISRKTVRTLPSQASSVDRSKWIGHSNRGTGGVQNPFDGNASSRWAAGSRQTGDNRISNPDWYGVDFGEYYMFDTLVIDNSNNSRDDGPRGYEVYALDEKITNTMTGAQIREQGRLIAEDDGFSNYLDTSGWNNDTKQFGMGFRDFPVTIIRLDKAVTSKYVVVIDKNLTNATNYYSIDEFYAYDSNLIADKTGDVWSGATINFTHDAEAGNRATATWTNGGTATNNINNLSYTSKHTGYDEFTLTLHNNDENYNRTINVTVYNYQVNDDYYVLDYGLKVDMVDTTNGNGLFQNDVLDLADNDNDLSVFGKFKNSTLAGAPVERLFSMYNMSGYSNNITTKMGDITTVEDNSLKAYYEPNKFMTDVDTFYYSQQVVEGNQEPIDARYATPVMVGKVSVMPATVVYYEDNFASSGTDANGTNGFVYGGTTITADNSDIDVEQSNSLELQYGYDDAYANQTYNFSNNGAYALKNGDAVAFEFHGTGFDIMSRTNNNTGIISAMIFKKHKGDYTASITTEGGVLDIVNKANTFYKIVQVNTYYENGDLYQVPVISWRDTGAADDYVVYIRAQKRTTVDATTDQTIYIDGIRIYNPINNKKGERYETVGTLDFSTGTQVSNGMTFNEENVLPYERNQQNNMVYESVTYKDGDVDVEAAPANANLNPRYVSTDKITKLVNKLGVYGRKMLNTVTYADEVYNYAATLEERRDAYITAHPELTSEKLAAIRAIVYPTKGQTINRVNYGYISVPSLRGTGANDLAITLVYFDEGTGNVGLQCPVLDNNWKGVSTACTNTKQWKEHTFYIEDVTFSGSQHGYDFRLTGGTVSKVIVQKKVTDGEDDAVDNTLPNTKYDAIGEKDAAVKSVKQLIFGEGYTFNYLDPLNPIVTGENGELATLVKFGSSNQFLTGSTFVETYTENKAAGTDPEGSAGLASNLLTYAVNGPNNELYLSANYGFGFEFEVDSNSQIENKTLQLAIKNVSGSVTNGSGDNEPLKVQYLNNSNTWVDLATIKSKTENYYRLDTLANIRVNGTNQKRQLVLKVVGGNGFISLTKVKVNGYTLSGLQGVSTISADTEITDEESALITGVEPKIGLGVGKNRIFRKNTYVTVKLTTKDTVEEVAVVNGKDINGNPMDPAATAQIVTSSRKLIGNNTAVWTVKFKTDATRNVYTYDFRAIDGSGNYTDLTFGYVKE
jgi:fibro-slime domain-containing protein